MLVYSAKTLATPAKLDSVFLLYPKLSGIMEPCANMFRKSVFKNIPFSNTSAHRKNLKTFCIAGGSRTVLPGGTAVPGRIPAGVPTINHRRLCYSGE